MCMYSPLAVIVGVQVSAECVLQRSGRRQELLAVQTLRPLSVGSRCRSHTLRDIHRLRAQIGVQPSCKTSSSQTGEIRLVGSATPRRCVSCYSTDRKSTRLNSSN